MTLYKDPNVCRKIIMKHYTFPQNKGQIKEGIIVEQHSNTCVDNIKLFLKIQNHVIQNVKFEGEGCAIFLASTDIMLNKIKNKTTKEVQKIMTNYNLMIQGKEFKENILVELQIFKNVGKHLNRLHCAEIIFLALEKFFLHYKSI